MKRLIIILMLIPLGLSAQLDYHVGSYYFGKDKFYHFGGGAAISLGDKLAKVEWKKTGQNFYRTPKEDINPFSGTLWAAIASIVWEVANTTKGKEISFEDIWFSVGGAFVVDLGFYLGRKKKETIDPYDFNPELTKVE